MKKNDKYKPLIDQIIGLVGGKSNISSMTHCVTRLRFNVKDKGLVDQKTVSELPGVIGEQWQNDQFQIIIGQDVKSVYESIVKENNIGELDANRVTSESQPKKKFSLNTVIEAIVACVIPLLSLLIGAGMIKLIMLLAQMANIISTTSPTYIILNFVSDAAFYFLPVFVGATASRRFKANLGLSMLMGAMLIHPTFVSSVTEGVSLDLFGLPVFLASYSSTIIPVILSVLILSYVERFAEKISPNAIKSLLVPLITLVVMVPLTLVILAPIGQMLSVYLTNIIGWLYTHVGGLTVAILAAILPFLIMTGMHTALIPYTISMMASLGYEPLIFAAMYISNVNQGIASLAVGIKSKNVEVKSLATSSAVAAIVAGVTEPAMYGINLKYKKPMIAATIGAFCGGLYAGLFQVYAYVLSGSGIFTFLSFVSDNAMNVINIVIALLISAVVTFVLSFILYKDEPNSVVE